MNYLKKIGWFLFDVADWIVKFFAYLLRKITKLSKSFFSREYFRKNKIKTVTVSILILAIIFSIWHVFQNYKLVIIPKDEQKQSVAEKNYLSAVRRLAMKPDDKKSGKQSETKPPAKIAPVQGKVLKIENDTLTVMTDKQEEKTIILDEKTKLLPPDGKLEAEQVVTVYTHKENDELVADRISVRKMPTVKPNTKNSPPVKKSD